MRKKPLFKLLLLLITSISSGYGSGRVLLDYTKIETQYAIPFAALLCIIVFILLVSYTEKWIVKK